jgi:hypothetical protein
MVLISLFVGLDIAFVRNGYVYHTRLDTEDRIPSGSLKRIGENLLNLVVRLAGTDWPKPSSDDARAQNSTRFQAESMDDAAEDHVTYFDFAGLSLISYGSTVRKLLAVGSIASFVVLAWVHVKQGK